MKGKPRHSRSENGHSGASRFVSDRARPNKARAPKPEKGRRAVWIYGVHPVLAALANPNRRIQRILIARDSADSLGPRIETLVGQRADGGPRPEIAGREALDRALSRGVTHQGVAILADTLDEPTVDDLCRATEGQGAARLVVLDQVTDPQNAGAILRSAAAFGAAGVVMPERHSPGAAGALAKAASGTLEIVPLVRAVNLARALETLKQAGFWCVGLDGAAKTPIHEADLSGRIALVLGAEGEGLRRLTREHCDLMVRVPLAAGVESLNVSNAAAVALYELARRNW